MNKEHFLIELKIYLKPLPQRQQAIVLDKYETIFAERMSAGENEEAIAKQLGKPRAIAEEILNEFDIAVPEKQLERNGWQEIYPESLDEPMAEETFSHPYNSEYQTYETPQHSGFVRFCQVIGIICFNFLFMIWVIFSIIMFLFSGWLVSIVFVLSPILGGLSALSGINSVSMFELFLSILLFGLGIIGLLLLVPLTKFLAKSLRSYLQWTIQVMRGER